MLQIKFNQSKLNWFSFQLGNFDLDRWIEINYDIWILSSSTIPHKYKKNPIIFHSELLFKDQSTQTSFKHMFLFNIRVNYRIVTKVNVKFSYMMHFIGIINLFHFIMYQLPSSCHFYFANYIFPVYNIFSASIITKKKIWN